MIHNDPITLPTKQISYPSQNAIFEFFSFKVRHLLVAHTRCTSLKASNKTVPFKFDHLSISYNCIQFDDDISYTFTGDKIIISNYVKGKGKPPRNKTVRTKNTEETLKKIIFNFYLARKNTRVLRLDIKSTSSLRFCPELYVVEELKVWNSHWTPKGALQKLHATQPLKHVEVNQVTQDSDIFKLPVIATAENWTISSVDVAVILDSNAKTITLKGLNFTSEELLAVYEKWKTNKRKVGTYLKFSSSDALRLYERICEWPGPPGRVNYLMDKKWICKGLLITDKTQVIIRQLDFKWNCIMEVVDVEQRKSPNCCVIC